MGLLQPPRRSGRAGRQVAVAVSIPNLDDLLAQGVSGRGVLVRSDLNVPLNDGVITDPGRILAQGVSGRGGLVRTQLKVPPKRGVNPDPRPITASVPTIKALADAGAKVVV